MADRPKTREFSLSYAWGLGLLGPRSQFPPDEVEK
jgi:hypothetical protein